MTKWRPSSSIRVKALGLHWQDGRLLASEIFDDSGRMKGVRPLGGHIDFGETWQAAVVREFREELGIDVSVRGEPIVMESIYVHEGSTGHEVVFIAEIIFPEKAFAGQDSITFQEDNGVASVARWFALDDLDVEGGPELYPSGLKDLLLNKQNK